MLPSCRSAVKALIAILISSLAATTAQAAIYYGAFDPNDGTYEWSGTHEFEVSDGCLSSGDGWWATNGESCTAKLIGGSLTLKKLSAPTAGPFTLSFQDFPGALNVTDDVWGVYVQGGQLAGIDSYLIGGFDFTYQQTLDLGFEVFCGDEFCIPIDSFYIRWESGKAPVEWVPENLFPGTFSTGSNKTYIQNEDPTYLYVNDCFPGECTTREVTPGVAAPNVTFQKVPEPSTLSMLLGAFGAAVYARRRVRRA